MPTGNQPDGRSGHTDARPAPAPRPSRNDDDSEDPALSPVEAALLTQGMVNDNAHEALRAQNFDDFIVSLQAANTSDVGERSAAYRIEIEESLQRHPELSPLSRFACGRTFCAGSINIGREREAFETWAGMLQDRTTLPIPAFSHRLIPQPDGTSEARFLFTTRGTGGFISSGKPR